MQTNFYLNAIDSKIALMMWALLVVDFIPISETQALLSLIGAYRDKRNNSVESKKKKIS